MTTLTPDLIGLPGFLILTGFTAFTTGLLRGWWVLGREYALMQQDRDFWRTRALRGTALAESATSTAETLAGGPP